MKGPIVPRVLRQASLDAPDGEWGAGEKDHRGDEIPLFELRLQFGERDVFLGARCGQFHLARSQ